MYTTLNFTCTCSYTPAELRYMPMNTAMYSSPRKFCDIYADPKPFSDNESDEEASVSNELTMQLKR